MEEKETTQRFRTEIYEHHGGGLFELEITTYFRVIENSTGKIVKEFEATSTSDFVAGTWANGNSYGVTKIEITPDEKFVLVYGNGLEEPEKVALPEEDTPEKPQE